MTNPISISCHLIEALEKSRLASLPHCPNLDCLSIVMSVHSLLSGRIYRMAKLAYQNEVFPSLGILHRQIFTSCKTVDGSTNHGEDDSV